MRDPAAPRQEVERELDRLEVRVAADAPEVARALAGCFLRPLHRRPALELVVDERCVDVPASPGERVRQRDRVLHRELGAGPDREVRGVSGIAEEHDPPVVPDPVRHLGEIEPDGAIREQLAPAEIAGEQLLAERKRLLFGPVRVTVTEPRLEGALDDERGHALVVRVRMHVVDPVLRLLEDEREGVEDVVGPEPDVLRALGLDRRPEVAEPSHERVRAVRAHDQIRVGQLRDLGAELELDADRAAPPLQDLQQALARDRRERVAARAQLAASVADVDAVPPGERVRDLEVRLRVGVAQGAECLLAEDDAPTERRIGSVSFRDPHLDRRVRSLQQDPEVEACRPAADDLDPHVSASASRSSSSGSATVGKRTSSSQPASS